MIVKEILLAAFIILIASYAWKWKRFFYLARKIPRSQFDLSWRGIYDAIYADNRMIFKMVYESFDNINGLAKTWLGPMLFVIISSPEDVKIIMNSKECLDKPYFIRFPGPVLEGTLFGDVEFWHKHRKILDPFFGQQKLKSLIPLFDEKSKVLAANVAKMVGKGDFEIFHYTTALTLETILNAMELEVDIQNLDSKQRDATIEGLEM
jgi:cytochrome P450